jgi:beta-lactamase class A
MNKYGSYRPARTLPKSGKQNYRRVIGLLLLIVGLVMVGSHISGGDGLTRLSSDYQKVSATTITPLVLSANQESKMSAAIYSAIGSDNDMDIGVAIEDLNNGKTYRYGQTQPFIAASVAKLITANLYLHDVETGKYKLSRQLSYNTAGSELRQMIEQSDNQAWEDFNSLLTHKSLKDYAASIGLTNYDPAQNTLTDSDIALLLGKFYRGELLNQADTDLLLSYMQSANETNYIVAYIPAGINVYHKAGWLDDRVHDAAIVDNGKQPYVLVIFTKQQSSAYDQTKGQQLFAAVTKATLTAFTQ